MDKQPTNDDILKVFDSLPLGAIMTGSKFSIAADVSKLLGASVTYDQIAAAITERDNQRKENHQKSFRS